MTLQRPNQAMEKHEYHADKASRHDPFPLTDIQHAYWVGRSGALDLGNVACHVYFEWFLKDLDITRLERAWNQVVARHDMMRAVIAPDGTQRILQEVPDYQIAVTELPPGEEAERLLLETRDSMSGQVMDPAQWPLFDLRVSRLSGGGMHLHLDVDLLMFDVQSFHIFLAELEQAYLNGEVNAEPLDFSFRDYVLAKKAMKEGPRYSQAREWWLERLEHITPAPELPHAVEPSALGQPSFTRHMRVLEGEKWAQLNAQAAGRGLTGSSVLLAAFSEILANWSRHPRFTLNLTHFNRERLHPDVMGMVGDFTSVLLVGADCSQPMSFAERARQLQKDMWGGLANRAFSGIEVMRELARTQGGANGTMMPVVFTSLLGLEIDRLADGSRPGALLGEPLHLRTATPQVWLDHQVMIRHGNLVYNWIVIDRLFPEGMVEQMLDQYGVLLERLSADEDSWDQPVGALTPNSQIEVREAVNRSGQHFEPSPLQDGLVRSATRDPARVAVLHPDGEISYEQLLNGAARLADGLRRDGLEAGDKVAVLLPKSISQIEAVYSILMAGGVYVPLPADIPILRLADICRDAGVTRAFVAEGGLLPENVQRLHPDVYRQEAVPNLEPSPAGPDDLAYIIYTSGSTGRPKGVMIAHGAAGNTIADINRRFDVGPDDRVLGLSSLAFDLSVYDIFGMATAGAALVLPREAERLDPACWLDLMERYGVTIWNSVPALLELLLEHVEETGHALPAGLRLVLLSGDWIPLGLPQRLRRLNPDIKLIALGGATEASIWSNYFDVREVSPDWTSIPYGYPLANQRYHVLDHLFRCRPDWVAGDLYIAGAGLAQGYWNDPEKTAQHFCHHPESGERLYKTGDIARYWPDGTIEFLGREDNQVKIGGHRVELGEIEAALIRTGGFREAVAGVYRQSRGNTRLAAHVVLGDRPEPVAEKIAPLPEAVEQALVGQAERLGHTRPAEEDIIRVQDFRSAGDRLAQQVIEGNFVALDIGDEGCEVSIPQLVEDKGIQPKYEKLLQQWAEALVEAGKLRRLEAGRYQLLRTLGCDGSVRDELASGLRDACGEEDTSLATWIETCAERQMDMLTGRTDPLEILFPDGDYSRANSLYRFNPVSRYFGDLVGELVHAAGVAGDSLNILEVGAGTGGTTVHLLPKLAGQNVRYCFTDLSEFFLSHAKVEFANHTFLDYARYDINLGPDVQGQKRYDYDLVLAVNVLHDAQDLEASLRHIGRLLRPGGVLVVLEATRNSLLQLITAGFLEGFSDFADFRKEQGLPLVGVNDWTHSLENAGLTPMAVLPGGDGPDLGQHVFLAQANSTGMRLDVEATKQVLTNALPAYMVPHIFVELDRLPLTANGKVDRKRLPLPTLPSTDVVVGEYAALKGESEEMVAAVWRELLACEQVGRNDNFFLLGGDSLLATRMSGELRRRSGYAVPLRCLYENPELAAFTAEWTARWNAGGVEDAWPRCLVLKPGGGAEAPLFLMPGSDGAGHVYRPLADMLASDRPVIALQTPGLAQDERALDTIEELALLFADEIAERSNAHDGVLLGGWSFGGLIAVETTRILHDRGWELGGMILIDPSPAGAFASIGDDPIEALGLQIAAMGETVPEKWGPPEQWTNLPTNDRRQIWWEVMRRNGLPLSDDTAAERFEAMLAAHLRALAAYESTIDNTMPDAPLLWLRASHCPDAWKNLPPLWPEAGCFETITGSHWTLLHETESFRAIADRIQRKFI